jgi:UPF0042 nucleotide-binding protein
VRQAGKARKGQSPELVVITGLSGSGKGTVLKALEDHGYYSVDNLPINLIPQFAELAKDSATIRRAALVVDVRERGALARFPEVYARISKGIRKRLIFLDADDATLQRRYSETRRPHPLGGEQGVLKGIRAERRALKPIRTLADDVILTSDFNVHELRRLITEKFGSDDSGGTGLRVGIMSFGFRHGVPAESDLVFDVRFLPNPNYIPEFKNRTGREKPVAHYIRSFPQTQEFLERLSGLLLYLLPHYAGEGKSYLTIALGCTGGHHRSVMMAEEIGGRLTAAGYAAQVSHRDIRK